LGFHHQPEFAMRKALVIAALFVTPFVAQAQTASSSGFVASQRGMYDMVKDYITRAAEQMPEEHYGFKPTPEVRSFGQLIGHVANANYMICSTVIGGASPNSVNIEQTKTTKADLVQAVKASFTYCDGAYRISEAQAAETTQLFGAQQPKLYVLSFNSAHDFEHYGNIVTYMRMKGLVPPSSQRGN
jgi:uncharacterized damage-inducible protein DinB